MKALRLPAPASPAAYWLRRRSPRLTSSVRVSPQRSRAAGGAARAGGICSAGAPSPALPYVDACGISQVPWRSILAPLPSSQTPAGPPRSRHLYRSRRCCPRPKDDEGSSVISISRLPLGFSACCLRFEGSVARPRQGSLPVGWLASSVRESNPLDRFERFPITHMVFLLSRAYPVATFVSLWWTRRSRRSDLPAVAGTATLMWEIRRAEAPSRGRNGGGASLGRSRWQDRACGDAQCARRGCRRDVHGLRRL